MAAVEKLVTQHLDLWATAIKRRSTAGRGSSSKVELYGIKKLRELILELAVRGALVPQDPKDEPASELLKRIAAEKAKLVKEGKIKSAKPVPQISEKEIPFEIPPGWANARLADVMSVLNGRAYKKDEMLSQGTPILRVGNLFTSNEWYFSDLELEPEKYIDDGDLIYAWSASFGPFIWHGGRVIYHYHIWKMEFFSKEDVDKFYFKHYLQAISAAIKESGNGIAMIHMTKERMEKLVLPIPPLSEQHRIVAKVDELMVLCDQLEQQTDASLGAHQTLVATLLNALTSAADHAQLASCWQRIADHFGTLFTTEESIDQLKQTILQLAVMGKLVPQDPNDEPASELLKAIAAEKAKLVEEGKIKADKPLPPVNQEEIPFELPKGWLWERLPNVSFFQEGPGIMAKDFRDTGVPLIRISGMHSPVVSLDGCNFLDEEMVAKKWNHFRLDEDDIVLSSSASLGKVSKVKKDAVGSIVYTGLIRFKPFKSLFDEYLIRFLGSREFERQIDGSKRGAAILHFGPTHLRGMILPVPPFAEQRRIVAKVDELMALCDHLKAQLADLQTTQLHLADALAAQALVKA